MRGIIMVWFLAAILGVGLFLYYYKDTRPESTVRVKISPEKAISQADQFLLRLGVKPSSYDKTVTLSTCEPMYLKKTFGMKKTREILEKGDIPCNAWSVRYFQEEKSESLYVSLDCATGKVTYFGRALEDNAPGVDLQPEDALRIAEEYFSIQGARLDNYHLVDRTSKKLPYRTDYSFQWEKTDYQVGDAGLRVFIAVQGEKLGAYSKFLKIPESFSWNSKEQEMPGDIAIFIFSILLGVVKIGVLVFLFIQYKYGSLRWKPALICAGVFFIVNLLAILNNLPGIWSGYTPWLNKSAFLSFYVLQEAIIFLWGSVWLLLVFVVGDSLARGLQKNPFPVTDFLLSRTGDPEEMRKRVWVGYCLGFIYAGYVTLFYLIGSHYTVLWKPIADSYAHSFRVYFPAFDAIQIFGGELKDGLFYFFFIIFAALKLFKKNWAAILIAAVFFAFEAIHPAVRPIQMRAIELIAFGLVWGWASLRYGIETVILSKVTFVVLLVAVPLIGSSVQYFQMNGWGALVLLFLPAWLVWSKRGSHCSPAR
ncbi:MAG: hypothetical protein WCI27_00220 [Candidatus Omnitrophota bacterium]